MISDDTYSNKSWSIVAQGVFQLREINQMEIDVPVFGKELNPAILEELEEMVCKDFGAVGP